MHTHSESGDPVRADRVLDLTNDAEYLANPYTTVSHMREAAPAFRACFQDNGESWAFTRHAEVCALLTDPRFVVDTSSIAGVKVSDRTSVIAEASGIDEEYLSYFTRGMQYRDFSEHARLRGLVSRAFTRSRVSHLRPRTEEIADGLLDTLVEHADAGIVDLLEYFAYPLSIAVLCELFGVPSVDVGLWRKCGKALMTMDPQAIERVIPETVSYIEDMIARRRRRPSGDLIDGLIEVQREDNDRLSESELITMVFTLLVGGHETTANLIANGLVALLLHPDQLVRVRETPGILASAVNEMQRWCGPTIAMLPRYALEDLELGGTTIGRGESAIAMPIAANRDGRHFAHPETFDISRGFSSGGEHHLGFGRGPHYCLGAALARQEADVAFLRLLHRFPRIELAVPPAELEWAAHPAVRKLRRLPLKLWNR